MARAWLVTIGEPLPTEGGARLLRTGLLADALVERGVEVTWWASAFDHFNKALVPHGEFRTRGYDLRVLPSSGYRSNVSLGRLREHRQVARAFRSAARDAPRPDVIVASLPTLELALESVEYGRSRNVPTMVDLRDMWPDIFVQAAPEFLRPFAGLLLGPFRRTARKACGGAHALTAHTEGFLDWGLGLAGRERRPDDAVFPFGYVRPEGQQEKVGVLDSDLVRWFDGGRVVLAFVGTVGRQFDFEPVVDAVRRFPPERGVRLVVCGVGESIEDLRGSVGDDERFRFTGWIGKDELRAVLALSTLGMAPYRDRPDFRMTISNKIPEYLSMGLPVGISLPSGTAAELIDAAGAGFSYEGSAELLQSRIESLLTHPEQVGRLSEAARALYARHFDANVVYGAFADHLLKIAGVGSPAGPIGASSGDED